MTSSDNWSLPKSAGVRWSADARIKQFGLGTESVPRSVQSRCLRLVACAIVSFGCFAFGAAAPVSTLPVVLFQERPVYSDSMRVNAMRGEVLVEFYVDREGGVRDPIVVRSLNPAFDVPALESVRKWRFVPGMRDGQPVETLMQVPMIFSLDETADGGQAPLVRRQVVDPSSLPEGFRYDTPPAARGTVRPVYPYALLLARVTGKSAVRYVVGSNGKVGQTLVSDASHSEFGRALQAALECFEFSPALKERKPVPAIEGFTQEFRLDPDLQIVSEEDLDLLKRERREGAKLGKHTNLDGVPRSISRRAPVYPLSVDQQLNEGQALIEFLIDETGKARLPRTVSASHEAFGYSAVQAVSQWLFEPPTVGGRPVELRMQVPFEFKRPQLQKNGAVPPGASESPKATASSAGEAKSSSGPLVSPPARSSQSQPAVPMASSPAPTVSAARSALLSVKQDEADAQFQRAEALLRENGRPSNAQEYLRLLRLASDQGHPKAMQRLAIAFRDGVGVPVDRVRAHCWLNLASAADVPGAREQLATVDGQITPEQRAEAEKMAREKWEAFSDIGAAKTAKNGWFEQGGSAPELISRTGGGSSWSNPAELRAAANAGNAKARTQLGELLLRGGEVKQDGQRGLELLEQAARAGEAYAAFRLGMLFSAGDSVAQDHARAAAYLRAAAVGGTDEAFRNVGVAYSTGRGVKRDYAEALAWFILAKQHNTAGTVGEELRAHLGKIRRPELITVGERRAPELERELARTTVVAALPLPAPLVYQPGDAAVKLAPVSNSGQEAAISVSFLPPLGGGVPAPAEQPAVAHVKILSPTGRLLYWPSVAALEREAEQGKTDALLGLGQILLDGKLVAEDSLRAAAVLQRAAQAGSADAAQHLGELYGKGTRIHGDDAKAFAYTLQAALGGVRTAIFNVGALYANGRGTAENYPEALSWLIVAQHFNLDSGSLAMIRNHVLKSKPEAIPFSEKQAAQRIREIEETRKNLKDM